jgi:hypothetical protein
LAAARERRGELAIRIDGAECVRYLEAGSTFGKRRARDAAGFLWSGLPTGTAVFPRQRRDAHALLLYRWPPDPGAEFATSVNSRITSRQIDFGADFEPIQALKEPNF